MATILNVLMFLDSVLYNLIGIAYEMFVKLAAVNLFDKSDYNDIVKRVYVILGVVMLFILAYSLLKAIINPDEFAKGEKSFPKLIQNIIISLIIIAVLPTAFTVAFNFQNSILNHNTIPRLILGNDGTDANNLDINQEVSYLVMSAFLHPNYDWCNGKFSTEEGYPDPTTKKGDLEKVDDINLSQCASNINSNGTLFWTNGENLASITYKFKNNEDGYTNLSSFSDFGESAANGSLSYTFLVATLAAMFLLYVIVNFCFDLAIRVIKLAFYQIIAPIPVICRVLPGGNMKDVFSKWLKQVISLFVEVFIRIGAMFFGVFLIQTIVEKINGDLHSSFTGTYKLLGVALLIMGTFVFIKEVPKLISDLFGIDTGGMKLGLKERLAKGGAFTAASAIGSGATTLANRLVGTAKNVSDAKGFWGKTGAAVSGLASAVTGGAFSTLRGGYYGLNAKNFKETREAASKSTTASAAALAKRVKYRAAHKGDDPIDTLLKRGIGHVSNATERVSSWAGINNAQNLMDDNKVISDIASSKKAMSQAAEDLIIGEANKNKSRNFGITGVSSSGLAFNTAKLRELRQNLDAAKATGASNVGALEDAYDRYKKEFVDAVQNQALLGKTAFNGLSDDDRADLGAVQDAADKYRGILKDNFNKEYVQTAGFTLDDFDPETSLDVGSGGLKEIGTKLKLAQNENNRKINELRKKEEQNKNE